MNHELKTWPKPFAAILDGRKRYEIRKADRPFAEGDTLRLREWAPCGGAMGSVGFGDYTGREKSVRVLYLTPPGEWGLPGDLCVMGIEPSPAIAQPAPVACPRCGCTELDTHGMVRACRDCSLRFYPPTGKLPAPAPSRAQGETRCDRCSQLQGGMCQALHLPVPPPANGGEGCMLFAAAPSGPREER